jgi:ABC-type sugar transport system ATPase subunit
MTDNQLLLRMEGITKRFPGVIALKNVDLELKKGEVLGLLGENGAGKSTLIKILSGAYLPDEGEIYIEEVKQNYRTPKEASDQGISIIYQELNYLNELTVAENIFLNRLPLKKLFKNIDWIKLHKESKKFIEELGVNINPKSFMKDISVAEKQLVEIAKAISKNMKILVMDEPTSALSTKEVEHLLELVRKLAKKGIGIIYISHRIEELFKVADRVQIMRDGEKVGERNINFTNRDELVQMMVGRRLDAMYPKREIIKGDIIFEGINIKSDYLNNISFNLKRGEILGVFGLLGAGQKDLTATIFGIKKRNYGDFLINGKKVLINSPIDAIKNGIAFLSDERKKDGLILTQNVKENITTASINKISKFFKMNLRMEAKIANAWKERFDIKTPSIFTLIENLSGGNQQKVILAKWLETNPKVLILNEPTRGIDVGSKVEIYRLMEEFCDKGIGIIMVSSELPEIIQLADRVIVLSRGRKTGEFDRKDITQVNLLHSAIGEN